MYLGALRSDAHIKRAPRALTIGIPVNTYMRLMDNNEPRRLMKAQIASKNSNTCRVQYVIQNNVMTRRV